MQKNDYSVELDITGDAMKRWAIFFCCSKEATNQAEGSKTQIHKTYIHMIYNTHIIFLIKRNSFISWPI